jgi:hypothetical protein
MPAQDVGGRREENAPAVGQPRDAQAITDSGGHSASFLTCLMATTSLLERCKRVTTKGHEAA